MVSRSGQGSHTLKWRFATSDECGGGCCGWVDNVRWSGSPEPVPDPSKWDNITYKYDPSGRRIEKSGNGEAIKYCYDGDHVIAEYDGNDRLLRKYIHGARVDEPVCMLEVADSNAVYYYHFDGLGSVVALSDSNGDSVQSYEYTVYGQVAAEDPDHPNPYMFTGRQFDIETGLYYYRARYYNPHIGRFMQTDPVGYADGINWYLYCGNNPLGRVDPSGLISIAFYDPDYGRDTSQKDWFKEYADDFGDYAFEMNSIDDVIAALEKLAKDGVEVTDVYFFDHCMNWEDYPNNPENRKRVYGLEFGKSELRFDDGSLEKYMRKIGGMRGDKGPLTNDATFHFRHCFLGDTTKNADRLEALVDWTGGDVTAVVDVINPIELTPDHKVKEMEWHQPNGGVVDMPDYVPTYGYTRAYRDSRGQFSTESFVRPAVIWPNVPRWTY